ncbi:hypothetical protein [Novosphingobium colocasiae]|nr:hypothetical protein [Novosphingobium colocasiae]
MMSHRLSRRARIALSIAACVVLSGCGDKKDDGAVQAAKGGEVLPRSITDDMLPYDTVRSQSGPDAVVGAPAHPAGSASDAASSEAQGAEADKAEPAEAAEATSSAE